MGIEVLVDGAGFWPRVAEDLRGAQRSLRVQSLSFALDGVGARLVEAMRSSAATDQRIIADAFYTLHKVDDRFAWHPRQLMDPAYRRERRDSLAGIRALGDRGIHVQVTNPCGFLFSKGFQRNHKKLVVVDERVAYVGGMNFTDHNFAWHDMMLRIEDPRVADWLAADFDATWQGRHRGEPLEAEGLALHRLDGRHNADQLSPLLERIAGARESIELICPYVSFPFFEPLAHAAKRGVRVRMLTPEADNWGLFSDYTSHVARRSGIEALVYPDRMLHLKAMLIDGELLIAGSANFYFVSHRFMQEYVMWIEDPATIQQFRSRVLEPDLKAARPAPEIPPWRGQLAETRLRLLAGLGGWLSS